MSSDVPRVLVLTNTVTSYSSLLYKSLAERGRIALKVVYCSEHHLNRPKTWMESRSSFTSDVLPGIHLYIRGESVDPIHLNPAVICRIREFKPDVLVIGGYSNPTMLLSMFYSNMTDIPYILMVDGGNIKSHPFPIRMLLRPFVESATAYISGGRSAETLLANYGADYRAMFRVPCVTDLERVHTIAKTLRSCYANGRVEANRRSPKTILYVGRLIKEKGILDLMDAYLLLRKEDASIDLLIVGTGPMKTTLEKAARGACPGSVRFIDYLEWGEDLFRAYSNSNVLVLPSYREAFGIVALEAFVSGLPVVVSDKCGCAGSLPSSEWVHHIQSGRIDSLVAGIKMALDVESRPDNDTHESEIRQVLSENSIASLSSSFENAVLKSLSI